MEFEKLLNLSEEQKKKILSDFIENDVSYWKKVLLLMAMNGDEEDNELLDLLIDHKIEEINLANKKYNLSLKYSEANDTSSNNYVSIMERIINGSNDEKYARACKEVLEILKFIPENYYKRINKKFIERLEKNADNTYSLAINKDTQYENLDIIAETKEILSLVSNKYWKIEGRIIDIKEIFNK